VAGSDEERKSQFTQGDKARAFDAPIAERLDNAFLELRE
jgi:hypothetical protein